MRLDEPFQIRAVQLDLARQMETLDFIKEFIDIIAENGYNTLVLYLEGRVRTESFPFPSEDESYSPDEMRDVVAHAATRSIDVIPAVQALGHAELFLRYPEMESLSELRNSEDMRGRWAAPAGRHDTFCPSLPETRSFLESYFTELADIFPSQYFHAGLDEAWHMGVCEQCRNHPEGQEGIFIELIQWLHSSLTGTLGKRVMLWDDMFQHYPNALVAIPKDIVLCCWHYDSPIDDVRWHFGGRPRIDKLNEFAAMGFDCLIAPADIRLNNVETFTEHASSRPCAGGLLTMWEKGCDFYHKSLPLIAYTGRLWNGTESERAFAAAVKSVCGVSDPLFVQMMRMIKDVSIREWRGDVDGEAMLRGAPTHAFTFTVEAAKAAERFFESYLERMPSDLGKMIVRDLVAFCQYGVAHAELRSLIPRFYQSAKPAGENDRVELRSLIQRFEAIRDQQLRFWERARPGLSSAKMKRYWATLLGNLRALPERKPTGIMTLSLYSQFGFFGIQETAVHVRFEGLDQWRTIVDNRLTPYFDETMVERQFAFPLDEVPVAVRFETYGYGRQGIRFIEIENARGRFVPDGVMDVKGMVIEPENVLRDDNWFALAGEKYTREHFNDLESRANRKRHGFEVSLKRVST